MPGNLKNVSMFNSVPGYLELVTMTPIFPYEARPISSKISTKLMIGTKYKNQIMYLYYKMPNLIAALGA